MTQRPDIPHSVSDPEALSAYLAGELDEAAATAFEDRLAAEPSLAAQLDALHAALVELGSLDRLSAPDGYEDRLRERLGAESAVVDIATMRRARARRWSAALTGAAAAVVLAVGGLQVLGRTGMDGPVAGLDMAMEADEDAEEQAALKSVPHGFDDGGLASGESRAVRPPMPMSGADGGGSAASDPVAPAMADSAQDAGPVITDDGVMLATDDDLRAYFGDRAEAERLRGTPRRDAEAVAAEHAARVREAEPFSDGTRPDTCIEQALHAEPHRVIARVERVRWQGEPALAYLTMTASEGSDALDRAELWLGEADGCAVHRELGLG